MGWFGIQGQTLYITWIYWLLVEFKPNKATSWNGGKNEMQNWRIAGFCFLCGKKRYLTNYMKLLMCSFWRRLGSLHKHFVRTFAVRTPDRRREQGVLGEVCAIVQLDVKRGGGLLFESQTSNAQQLEKWDKQTNLVLISLLFWGSSHCCFDTRMAAAACLVLCPFDRTCFRCCWWMPRAEMNAETQDFRKKMPLGQVWKMHDGKVSLKKKQWVSTCEHEKGCERKDYEQAPDNCYVYRILYTSKRQAMQCPAIIFQTPQSWNYSEWGEVQLKQDLQVFIFGWWWPCKGYARTLSPEKLDPRGESGLFRRCRVVNLFAIHNWGTTSIGWWPIRDCQANCASASHPAFQRNSSGTETCVTSPFVCSRRL